MVTAGLHRKVVELIPEGEGILVNLGAENWMPALGYEDCNEENLRGKNYKIINVDIRRSPFLPEVLIHDLNHAPYPFEDKSVDVVLSVDVIEHLENPWLHLREIKRILKPNGVAIVTTPNILAPCTLELWPHFNWFKYPENYEIEGHINPMPVFEFKHIAKTIGFPIEKELYHPEDSKINLVLVFRKK